MLDHGAWALMAYRLSHSLYRAAHIHAACGVWKVSRIITGVDIYPSATIGYGLKMPHPNGIVIGQHVRIGNDVTILQQVTVGAQNLDAEYTELTMPLIGDKVLLGSGCKVLGGITIGESTIVGANAVVLSDLPPHCTAVGIPARIASIRKSTE